MKVKTKILVVDDDPEVLHLLGEALSQIDVEAQCVASSLQAAELINRDKFDGVFLDSEMPVTTGMELVERARHSSPNSHCPIAMIGDHVNPELRQEGLRLGIDFFLPKPVRIQQLRRLLTTIRNLAIEDRRSCQRVAVQAPVLCEWNQQKVKGQGLNLSVSGMLVALEAAPPLGTAVQLEFSLPGDSVPFELAAEVKRVTIIARVVRLANSRHVGCRFVDLGQGSYQRLTDFTECTLAAVPAIPF